MLFTAPRPLKKEEKNITHCPFQFATLLLNLWSASIKFSSLSSFSALLSILSLSLFLSLPSLFMSSLPSSYFYCYLSPKGQGRVKGRGNTVKGGVRWWSFRGRGLRWGVRRWENGSGGVPGLNLPMCKGPSKNLQKRPNMACLGAFKESGGKGG